MKSKLEGINLNAGFVKYFTLAVKIIPLSLGSWSLFYENKFHSVKQDW